MKSSKELGKCICKRSSKELGKRVCKKSRSELDKKVRKNVVRTRKECMIVKERETRQESIKEK